MTLGTVFDLQRYAVHDGPGIRTLVFLKGCPLSCPWCCNPESQKFAAELKHGSPRCRACGRCAAACPRGRNPAGEKWDRSGCGTCDGWPCVGACPHGALGRVGKEMSTGDLLAEVLKDRAFYDNSGGGVTLSGGEPLAQPAFVAEFLAGCDAASLHTAVETCGFAPPEVLRKIEPLVRLFFFDLKIANPDRHLKLLGAPLAPVLENLGFLASRRPSDVVVRVPVVPGYTDDRENLEAIAGTVAGLGLRRVELEPYHALGEAKYHELGRELEFGLRGRAASPDDLARAVRPFLDRGLAVSVEGF